MTRQVHKISKYSAGVLQGALQFQVTRPREGLTRAYALERRTLSVLSLLLLVLIVAYLYFVASSIFAVMARADAERNIRTVETNLASLEQQYLALAGTVSQEAAVSDGLTPVTDISYVNRPGNTALAQPAVGNLGS